MDRSPLPVILTFISLLLLLNGCSRQETAPGSGEGRPSETPPRLPIPAPDLSQSQPAVREQIAAAKTAVERGEKRPEERQELAGAFGDLGLVYLTYAFTDAAEASFVNARQSDPSDYRWPYLEGYVHHLGGRPEIASASFEAALELAPNNVPALIRLGRARLDLDALIPARLAFERALEIGPENAAMLEGLAKVAAAEGDATMAGELFQRALALQPTAKSLYQGLGLAYRSLGRLEEARAALEEAGEALVVFEDPVLVALAELGRSTDLLTARGARAYTDGRYAEAATFFRKALELDDTSFELWKQRIFSLEKLGALEQAKAEVARALGAATTGDPEKDSREKAHLHRMRGVLALLGQEDGAAIDDFSAALELSPEMVDTRLQLADALGRQGRFAEALPHYERLLERQPERADLRLRRGTTLINLGRGEEGLAEMQEVAGREPENAEAGRRLAAAREYLRRDQGGSAGERGSGEQSSLLAAAEALTRQGDYPAAIERCREALRLDPGSREARYQLATLLGHVGDLAAAVEEFGTLLRADPVHGAARRGQVTALLLGGRHGAAKGVLEEGLGARPTDLGLAHGLARILASAPTADVRDGPKAMTLAQRVLLASQSSASAETAAMALAELGQFPEAAKLQGQVLDDLRGRGSAAALAEKRLRAYQAGKPWRAESAEEFIMALR